MRCILALFALVIAGCNETSDPQVPLGSGNYTFQHRFAEHPTIPSGRVNAKIRGTHIVLSTSKAFGPFPAGVLAEGELMWHASSEQWIIGHAPSDRSRKDVGGCSDGPEVIDLTGKIYWTC